MTHPEIQAIRDELRGTQYLALCADYLATLEAKLNAPCKSAPKGMSADGMLPCPFCGEQPETEQDEDDGEYFVFCANGECDIQSSVRGFGLEVVRELWNTRAHAAPAMTVTDSTATLASALARIEELEAENTRLREAAYNHLQNETTESEDRLHEVLANNALKG